MLGSSNSYPQPDSVVARSLPGWAPPARNLSELMHRQVRANGHSPFLTFYDDHSGERTELSYATFDNWVAKTANLLSEEFDVRAVGADASRQHGRPARIAIALGTHWTTVVVAFAAWRVGACVVPIPIDQSGVAARLNELLSLVRPDVVVASENIAGKVADEAPVVAVGGGFAGRLTVDVPDALPYAEQVLAYGDDFDDPDVLLDDPALLVVPPWSGGTTTIVLDQSNLLAGALALIDWGGLTAEQRVLCAALPGPVDGLVLGLLAPFLCGGTSVLVRNLDLGSFGHKIRNERVTWALTSHALLKDLVSVDASDVGPLQGLLCPSPVSRPLRQALADRTGLRIHAGHGVTAATCASTLEPVDVDDDTRAWLDELDGLPVGSPTAWAQIMQRGGELCVRGPVVMVGHDCRPDLDVLAFADGWLHTGDSGVVLPGPDGRLHVLLR